MTAALWTRRKTQLGNLPDIGTLKGDSAYPSGGYTLDHAFGAGMKYPYGASFVANNILAAGYEPRFDFEANRIRVFRRTLPPPLIIEEPVVIASNTGRLAYVPGPILAVQVTAGTTTGPFKTIPKGTTPLTKQVAIDFTTGNLTFLSTDAVTAVSVTYVAQGIGGFTAGNLVIDELVALNGTTGAALANQAAYIQYVFDPVGSGAATRPQLIRHATVPTGTKVAIKFDDSGSTTKIYAAAGVVDVVKVTYFKKSAIGVAQGYVAQGTITVTSNAIALGTVLANNGLFVPNTGEIIPAVATSTDVEEIIQGPSGTSATGTTIYNPLTQNLAFNSGDSITTIDTGYIVLDPSFALMVTEVPAGTNLTGMQWRAAIFSAQG